MGSMMQSPPDARDTGDNFELLICEMSTRFVRLSASELESELERAQQLLCDGLGVDRSTLWQTSPDAPGEMLLTHVYERRVVSPFEGSPDERALHDCEWALECPENPPICRGMNARAYFPWVFSEMQAGRTVAIERLEDLPPEAARDRETFARYETHSTVVVPMATREEWLGCISFASTNGVRRWTGKMIRRFELVGQLFTHALARRASNAALRHSEALLHAILDTAAEGIITIDTSGMIESANMMAEQIFGYGRGELVGSDVSVLMPEHDRPQHGRFMARYCETAHAKVIGAEREFVGSRKNGTTFPIALSLSETNLGGKRAFTGFVRDISERKKAEESLRESETRFRSIADSAPVLIWMSDAENRCLFVNKPWKDFTGRTMEQEAGKGWIDAVHAEDLPEFLACCERAFAQRSAFVSQCRLRRHDGIYRWMTNNGAPRFDAEGKFCGFIGSCVDLTVQIEAERAARDLSGRLINAQEEERARLARDLHDDVTQRLARLAIDAGRAEHSPSLDAETEKLVRAVREGLVQLSEDIHVRSHQLHPSAVIDLGLVDALKAECDEFSRREAIGTKMSLRQLPEAIPRDMALGLFRIAQESLNNAVRHGRASKVNLSLWGMDGGVQLVIQDDGVGFDPSQHRHRAGMGLASMRERARLLGGTCYVESSPGGGTIVVAWVPLTEDAL